MDAVACNGEIIQYAISEHVENAGVHSGDATLVLPPQRTYLETVRQIRHISKKIAAALQINGPFNIQFIAKRNEVKVIECNLRASRSFPFVSKILNRNFIDIATRAILGLPVEKSENSLFEVNYVGVKAPQFSFTRLEGADPTLGVEMASTGEVACLGDDFNF
jgi:carbamoyl-phosphate synthase large subunit